MRYQAPRYAQDSAEKNKKEQQAVIRSQISEVEEDGETYRYEHFNAPLSPKAFNRMTKGRHTTSRRT